MAAKLGIALGSGGARGWAHIGVLGAFAAARLEPDIVCGTSIGAVIGAISLAGGLPDFAQYVRRMNRVRLSQYFDFKFGAGGMIAGNRVMKKLQPIFRDGRIEDLPRVFGCVATDLSSGDEVWLREGRVLDALAASYAIPGLFPPVQRGGRWLFDGAFVNPVPVSLARALGAGVTVAVDVNAGLLAPLAFEGDESGLAGRRGIGQALVRAFFGHRKGGPSSFGVMGRSLQIVQTRLSRVRLAEDPPAVVIRPLVGHIGPMEFHRAAECIEAGAAAAHEALARIREALRAAGPH